MTEDQKYIELLLEKYFEGQTTLEEEQMLRSYFEEVEVPESLEIYKPIFAFFSQEIDKEKQLIPIKSEKKSIRFIYWITAVAACILLFIGIKTWFFQVPDIHQVQSMVYINGKAFSDQGTINNEALNALENISKQNNDIINSQIDILESFKDE